MKPRGFWYIFFRIAIILGPLFVFLCTLLISFMIMKGLESGQILRASIMFGIAFMFLVVAVVLTAFAIKAIVISVTFQDRKAFLSRLNVVLAEIGYHPESQTESFLTYKPSLLAGLLAGRISAQIDDNSATLVGPNWYIKKLQKWLQQ